MAPTKTPTKAPSKAPAKAASEVAVMPQALDHDELMDLLGQAGMLPKGGDSSFRRMQLVSGILVTDPDSPNEERWPPDKTGLAMRVRIVRPVKYYSAIFFGEQVEINANGAFSKFDARDIGRPELNGKFAKKYDDTQDQANDEWSNLEAYEAFAHQTGQRGQFKGDIDLQIVPDSGEMTGDEPVFTLSLSTTACLDFRGTTKNRDGGIVQDKNFIIQLSELAAEQAIKDGGDKDVQRKAILDAFTAYRLGGVFAGLYVLTATNTDKSRSWSVPAFKPFHIELGQEAPALPDPSAAGPEQNGDDIPF